MKIRPKHILLKIETISKLIDYLDNVQALLALWRCVKECKNISFLPKKVRQMKCYLKLLTHAWLTKVLTICKIENSIFAALAIPTKDFLKTSR